MSLMVSVSFLTSLVVIVPSLICADVILDAATALPLMATTNAMTPST